MLKGPRLNNNIKNFTTRDSLGIEGVAATISGEICPIVNTVTPRAFYWPFMVWIYYDFYKYSGIKEHTYQAFDLYLKRQDYFFVLATLLTPNSDQVNLVGKQQTEQDILDNPNGPYEYNPAYFKTRFGGMQYYNAGCLSMYFIVDHDYENDKDYSFPILTKEGEEMALAFEKVIKNTEYYCSYRNNDCAVPRKVLEEYGKIISISLKGFDSCKQLLKKYMFEDNRAIQLEDRSILLSASASYLKHIVNTYKVDTLNREICRRLFFDHEESNGKKMIIPDNLSDVSNKWEIAVGRQYFTSGMEMIWKFMLEQLNSPLTLKQWIENAINISDFTWDMNDKLCDIIQECNYDYETREKMIYGTSRGKNSLSSIENGIRVILSVYNRFYDRTDFHEEKAFLSYGDDSQSISLTEAFEIIDGFKNHKVQDFLVFVMKQWLVEQHYITAFEKMMQNRDGFYYEIIDRSYVRKHEFYMDFQGIRMIQLMQVMKDLDML
jgi:hypothetical protein